MAKPLYQALAINLAALARCEAGTNPAWAEWADRYRDHIDTLVEQLPSGSGIDNGTKLLIEQSTPNKLVFQADYHHMDQHGYYAGWTEHKVIVQASLEYGFDIRITGRDRNHIKEYLHETFSYAFTQLVEVYPQTKVEVDNG